MRPTRRQRFPRRLAAAAARATPRLEGELVGRIVGPRAGAPERGDGHDDELGAPGAPIRGPPPQPDGPLGGVAHDDHIGPVGQLVRVVDHRRALRRVEELEQPPRSPAACRPTWARPSRRRRRRRRTASRSRRQRAPTATPTPSPVERLVVARVGAVFDIGRSPAVRRSPGDGSNISSAARARRTPGVCAHERRRLRVDRRPRRRAG